LEDLRPVAPGVGAKRPGVTSVIIGPRTVDQLEENLVGFRLDLPNELAGRLDDISRSGVR
jgi:aryl-alcohol dehydrogenase-like predicted oxidoreductase